MLMSEKKVKLFSLSSNKELAEQIASSIDMKLGDSEVVRFADGEVNVNINETVRGCDVFVIQSTSAPANDNLMELLIMCDALKRASAKSITCVIPYYGYARQDRKSKSRQPISAKLVADIIQTAGANRVITMDIHAAQVQGFFNIPVDNFMGLPILSEYIIDKKLDNICVISPDHGGVTRARAFAKVVDAPLAIIDKRRPEPNKAKVMNIIGNVEGMNCVIVDDIIDTAGTLCAATEALLEAGAKSVYACATHGVLSAPAVERINASNITEVVITNTIFQKEEKRSPKIKVLSVGSLLGHGIKRVIEDEPISGLFTYFYDRNKRDLL